MNCCAETLPVRRTSRRRRRPAPLACCPRPYGEVVPYGATYDVEGFFRKSIDVMTNDPRVLGAVIVGGGVVAYLGYRTMSRSYYSLFPKTVPVQGTSSTTDVNWTQRWVPINAARRGTPGKRSAAELYAIAAQFHPESNPRYAQEGGGAITWCNIFVWDVTRALGAEIPHWDGSTELNANRTVDWMTSKGYLYGWSEISRSEAVREANKGYPVVAMYKSGTGGIGHVALVLPSKSPNYPDMKVAQAGAANLFDKPIEQGFGSGAIMKATRFFVHS